MQIALLSVVPLGLLPLFVPFWARMFDEGHVVEYRARRAGRWSRRSRCIARHLDGWMPLLWIGAVLLGVRVCRLEPRLESRAQ
jgi:hypothetical protein